MFTTYTLHHLLAARAAAHTGERRAALAALALQCDRPRPVTRGREVTQ